jgi:hypothetical protein
MKRPLLLTILTAFAVLAFAAAVAFAAPPAAPAAQEAKPIIAQPAEGAGVRDVVQIIGTATHPQFQRYELYYAPFPVPSDQSWIFIGDAHNNQQPLGLLGTWDSRSVPDGSYVLRVRVVRLDGNYIDSDPRRVQVANTQPVDTPTPATPEEPLPELPPTESPDAPTAVIGQPTAAGPSEGVAVPTIAPTPTPAVTIEPAGSAGGDASGTPTAGSTRTVIASSSTGSADSSTSLEDSASSIADQLFSGSRLMDTAKKAAIYTAGAFVVVGLFFGVKNLLVWLWYKIKP